MLAALLHFTIIATTQTTDLGDQIVGFQLPLFLLGIYIEIHLYISLFIYVTFRSLFIAALTILLLTVPQFPLYNGGDG